MKLILVIGFLSVLTIAGSAFGADPCQGLPTNATEVEAWVWHPTLGWLSMFDDIPMTCATARLWSSGLVEGTCNKGSWEIPVTIHASVAQWIKFSVTGTRWDWHIMKPGTYAGDCITFSVCSNGEIGINYDGFDNLYSATACDQYIETWYGYGLALSDVEGNGWVPAPALNDEDDILTEPFLCDLGHCFQTKLWTKVQVDSCNTACEYENAARITLTLNQQKPWVDADGSWCDRGPCPIVP